MGFFLLHVFLLPILIANMHLLLHKNQPHLVLTDYLFYLASVI